MADPTTYNRDWIEIFAALLTPMIAVIGIIIAIFQWRLNERRHKHELFDKRWKQFCLIRDYMASVRQNGVVSSEEDYHFTTGTRGCRFLFDEQVSRFVDEVKKKVILLISLEKEINGLSGPRLKKNTTERKEIKDWLESELKKIESRFEKFLQLK